MKSLMFVVFLSLAVMGIADEAKKPGGRPDFRAYNPDGSLKTRGVYEVDGAGRVSKYSVYDGAGKLRYTEVPYYAGDGRILRADRFDASGQLSQVVVFFEKFAKVLDRDGNVAETQAFSQLDFLRKKP